MVWQSILILLHLRRRSSTRWPWVNYLGQLKFTKYEPFLQLYDEIVSQWLIPSDYTVEEHYELDPISKEVISSYSHIRFNSNKHRPGYAHFYPLTLGVADRLCIDD